jgi:glutathione S-transferase
VPVLEIDGTVLAQSLATIEYLDETRQTGLLPSDAIGRARVRATAYAVVMNTVPSAISVSFDTRSQFPGNASRR